MTIYVSYTHALHQIQSLLLTSPVDDTWHHFLMPPPFLMILYPPPSSQAQSPGVSNPQGAGGPHFLGAIPGTGVGIDGDWTGGYCYQHYVGETIKCGNKGLSATVPSISLILRQRSTVTSGPPSPSLWWAAPCRPSSTAPYSGCRYGQPSFPGMPFASIFPFPF